MAGGALRKPKTMLTSAGNKTTIAPMTATDICSRPKIRMIIGAIAISGTERSNMAIGISACSMPFERLNKSEIRVAKKIPTTKPIDASIMVWPSAAITMSRFSLAAGTSNMNL